MGLCSTTKTRQDKSRFNKTKVSANLLKAAQAKMEVAGSSGDAPAGELAV